MMLPFLLNLPERTPHGIDGLSFCIKFMEMLDGNGNLNANYDRMKAFIVSQLKRGMTPQEDHDLAQGILNYIQSVPETNERLEAMYYLFNMKFISRPISEQEAEVSDTTKMPKEQNDDNKGSFGFTA